ncbi:hypothetical protein HOLleu_02196 [Holothuria leucospilota]|uniref:Uncharacterized protein n=1 Tax=Holothuria leucospilota TaxID=206669 RepID=A0A9Q1HL78_HOLLE|nr:hypothetical protein HOLleu_02196 [Holothuria leucospilota]
MTAPGSLSVRKVPNSSPTLVELKKHHHDQRLVSFNCEDFPRLCIAKGGKNFPQKSKIFARLTRRCTSQTDTFKLSVVSLRYHPLSFPQTVIIWWHY